MTMAIKFDNDDDGDNHTWEFALSQGIPGGMSLVEISLRLWVSRGPESSRWSGWFDEKGDNYDSKVDDDNGDKDDDDGECGNDDEDSEDDEDGKDDNDDQDDNYDEGGKDDNDDGDDEDGGDGYQAEGWHCPPRSPADQCLVAAVAPGVYSWSPWWFKWFWGR